MSGVLIQHYLNDLATLRHASGSHRESVVREAFKDDKDDLDAAIALKFKRGYPRDNIKEAEGQTIRAEFDTYRFAADKEHAVDLLARVSRVSVQTQAIVAAMREAAR